MAAGEADPFRGLKSGHILVPSVRGRCLGIGVGVAGPAAGSLITAAALRGIEGEFFGSERIGDGQAVFIGLERPLVDPLVHGLHDPVAVVGKRCVVYLPMSRMAVRSPSSL
jgi:hypothetical protein